MNIFLNNVKAGKNDWWRYILTLFTICIGLFIGGFLLDFIVAPFAGISNITSMMNIGNTGSGPNFVFFYLSIFIQFLFGAIFFVISIKYIHKRSVISVINNSKDKGKLWIKRIRWNKILKGLVIWTCVLLISLLITYIFQPGAFVLNPEANILLIIGFIILSIPIQITFEELIFRGYLNQGLSLKIKNPIIIIILSSIIFGILHIGPGTDIITGTYYIFYTAVIGLILSIYTLVDEGIEKAIGIHLANNIFSFALFPAAVGMKSSVTIFIGKGDSNLDMIITFIIPTIYLIGLIIYKKKQLSNLNSL